MMRKLIGILMVAVLAAGISSCNSKPQPPKDGEKCCNEHKMEPKRCDKEKGGECCIPNVTEEQKAKFKELKDAQMAEATPLMDALKTKHEQMKGLMEAEPVNLEAVNALVDEIFVIKASLKKLDMANMIEMNKLLTPEQKAAMKEKCANGPKEGGCCGEHKGGPKEGGCCGEQKGAPKEGCDGNHEGCKKECGKK